MAMPATDLGAKITDGLKEEMNVDDRPWFKNSDPDVPDPLQPYPEPTLPDMTACTVGDPTDRAALLLSSSATL
jgi:hypothetical protein